MIVAISISGLLILVEFGILFFLRRNHNRSYLTRLNQLKGKINLQKKQVEQREKHLLVYNFLKYNLSQALVNQKNVY